MNLHPTSEARFRASALAASLLLAPILHSGLAVAQSPALPIPAAEYAALTDFYNSTGGGTSWKGDGWLDPKAAQWSGVDVEGGHVVGLALSGFNSGRKLTGRIPDSIGALTSLQTLDLDSNQLSGPIPESIGTLASLSYLDLSFNQLEGSVPAGLGALPYLNYVDLGDNRLTGVVPASLGGLQSLGYFSVEDNNLTEEAAKFSGNTGATFVFSNNQFDLTSGSISKSNLLELITDADTVLFAPQAASSAPAPTSVWGMAMGQSAFWTGLVSSTDGSRWAAVGGDGTVMYSADGGQTWRLGGSGSGQIQWSSVACTGDGMRLVASALGTYDTSWNAVDAPIYASNDGGVTWTATGSPSDSWAGVACSKDGSRLMAASSGNGIGGRPGAVWLSTNGGAAWAQTAAPPLAWTTIACAADGSFWVALAAGGSSTNTVYTSSDLGATWTPRLAAYPGASWAAAACSADGSRVFLAAPGLILTSADGGETWAAAPAPEAPWATLSCSADGRRIFAAAPSGGGNGSIGRVYSSSDAGATWIRNEIPPQPWRAVSVSGDGSKAVALQFFFLQGGGCGWGGGGALPTLDANIYVGAMASPTLSVAGGSGGVTLSWPAWAGGFQLQTSALSRDGVWSPVLTTPGGDGVTLSLTLPLNAPGAARFFRLIQP